MAFDLHLAGRLRAALSRTPGITEQRMFGGLAFLRHGLMVVAVTGQELLVRLGPQGSAQALQQAHVRPMDLGGRVMSGFVRVDEPGTVRDADLGHWLQRALTHVATLAPKPRARPRAAGPTPKTPPA